MKKKDIFLIVGILLTAGLGYLLIGRNVQGSQVVITLDGEVYGTYSLQQDQRLDVKSEAGHNVVVIENGEVFIEDADCPDRYCVKQGRTSSESKSLICLPHKLVVEVRGQEDKDADLDAVAQ